jgi:rhodanese-related sulfurtransferase
MFFLGGIFFGIFLFGETVSEFAGFWNSSYLGRFTLMDWLGLPTGVVVLLAVAMALFMFWGGEQLEKLFGDADPKAAPKWRYGAAGFIALAAIGLIVIGQPNNADRWNMIADEREAQLAGREVQIHPAELVHNIRDKKIKVVMLDVRGEVDYNLFHILDAENVPLEDIDAVVPELHLQPANTIFVVMSNDEAAATEAWKILVAESVPNVYILEGGINNWIDTFADEEFRAAHPVIAGGQDDQLHYVFEAALGDQIPTAVPPLETEIEYTSKVKLELKRAPTSGGCG